MSGSGRGDNAADQVDKKRRVPMEIENNSALDLILVELKKITAQLSYITGEDYEI